MVLNSVPTRGSGFRRIKEIFGQPPVFDVRGLKADILSSRVFRTDAIQNNFIIFILQHYSRLAFSIVQHYRSVLE
jgi:hypothetical protein